MIRNILKKWLDDFRYRTVWANFFSVWGNLLFAIINGIYGIIMHSTWFGSLAAYYLILICMRYICLRVDTKAKMIENEKVRQLMELKAYRNCGIILIALTFAMAGSFIQIVMDDDGKFYPGYLIYLVALYTFIKAITAIRNLFIARRQLSPLLLAIKFICYADAAMSMMYLQTAMFASFGNPSGVTANTFNSITAGVITAMLLFLGSYMIISASNQKNKISVEIDTKAKE